MTFSIKNIKSHLEKEKILIENKNIRLVTS
jgi:hypothetical protein